MNPPMEQVTANVYANTKIRGCNPSYVVTSDGVVVVDTPQLPTRAVAMRILEELGIPLEEVNMTRHEVFTADECFLTGSAAEIIPVVKVDNRTIGDGEPGAGRPLDPHGMQRKRRLGRRHRRVWRRPHSRSCR